MIHTGYEIEQCTLKFHDDVSSAVLQFWKSYLQWYFADFRSGKTTSNWDYSASRGPISKILNNQDWGFCPQPTSLTQIISGIFNASGETATNFYLSKIELYLLYGAQYTKIVYVNPKITHCDCDAADTSSGEGSEITMSFKSEGVIFEKENASVGELDQPGFLLLRDYFNVQ